MITCRSLFRIDRVLKLSNAHVLPNPVNYFQSRNAYHCLSCDFIMGGGRKKQSAGDHNKKRKMMNPVWRPVSTRASSCEEGGDEVQEMGCSTSSSVLNDHAMKVAEAATEITELAICSSTLPDDVENKGLDGNSAVSNEKHSVSVQVGASLFRFIKGKGGSTQQQIEEEMGVKIIIPTSKDDYVTIEGTSIDSVTSAWGRIQAIIDEAVKSRNLDYSHFISLPLAIHPELVDKLISFQNSILGKDDSCLDENLDADSSGDATDNEEVDQLSKEEPNVVVKLEVYDSSESVKVNLTSIPLVSYAPKVSNSSASSDLRIDKSVFIKPKTFHLTVLMLKLWNKDRVTAATEVLQSISCKVMEALDNRPVSVRLKGLDCMKGSLAKAHVLYAPVEEIGSEGRLLRACQVIIDAYTEAGLVLENDAKQTLKLHATMMNARHRKRKKGTRTKKSDSFDARGIFKQYGSEDWGEYLIREAHLSQRFSFDENGYYHCCASIPFPENMQV
ncbi:hypothetical protein L6164_021511 [Bauhinia variegata]|uniref:Uncharacterized protein n=1 Tax=Bauhinia variegata TaxID=167791 RepID=A0ACB9N0M7_BAUVA|nr:hypothetical protein L6164_021511 [Bauhinia variegata]